MEYCCNPFQRSNHRSTLKYGQLRYVTPAIVESARSMNIRLIPNIMQICNDCRMKIQKEKKRRDQPTIAPPEDQQQIAQPQAQPQLAQEPADDGGMDVNFELPQPDGPKYPSPAVNYVDKAEFVRKLNELLPQIEVTAIDCEKIARSRSYCRSKLDEITTNLGCKIFDLTMQGAGEVAKDNPEQEIVMQLKEKFAETTEKEQKVKILSILPRSWSARKISKEFSTTVHLPLLTKRLVEENGIMCGPKKRTNTIDPETVKCVKEFYSSDEISRVCPGKRDYVTVDENNVKISKQRRLILMNLQEAYATFKTQHINLKVGFSKFASLRPPECILALDMAGTHRRKKQFEARRFVESL